MIPRWITTAYLLYLATPIALLFIWSFGDLWLNTLLPTGTTLKWYDQVAADPSFRRAFRASLFVAVMTASRASRSVCRSPTQCFGARSSACAHWRALYHCLSLPALVLAFGFILVSFRPTPCRGWAAYGC
jgi:putative spermidine/putrescine transport system permease protein